MARHRSNENVCNLEFHHIQTSASKKVMITVSDPFPLMWQYLDRQQPQTLILVITSSAMRVEKLSKAIWFISSGVTTKMLKISLTFSRQISQKVWRRPGGRDWISRLRHSYIASLAHKSTSDHKSWVHHGSAKEAQREFFVSVENARRKPDISKSVQRFHRSSQLIRQKSGLILRSN